WSSRRGPNCCPSVSSRGRSPRSFPSSRCGSTESVDRKPPRAGRRSAELEKTARPAKMRLDALLVDRGLASTRRKAQAMILAGEAKVGGRPAGKPGASVDADAPVEIVALRPPRVGRAGEKLEGALDGFGIDVAGRRALDIGASTGGFTECLLRR